MHPAADFQSASRDVPYTLERPTENRLQDTILPHIMTYLKNRIGNRRPGLAIILGSGLGAFADELTNRVEIPYTEIPDCAGRPVRDF